MAKSAYVQRRLAEIELEKSDPGNWWHSGRYWYCGGVKVGYEHRISGCGVTRAEAIRDFHREMSRQTVAEVQK